jgi:hypothetical protein
VENQHSVEGLSLPWIQADTRKNPRPQRYPQGMNNLWKPWIQGLHRLWRGTGKPVERLWDGCEKPWIQAILSTDRGDLLTGKKRPLAAGFCHGSPWIHGGSFVQWSKDTLTPGENPVDKFLASSGSPVEKEGHSRHGSKINHQDIPGFSTGYAGGCGENCSRIQSTCKVIPAIHRPYYDSDLFLKNFWIRIHGRAGLWGGSPLDSSFPGDLLGERSRKEKRGGPPGGGQASVGRTVEAGQEAGQISGGCFLSRCSRARSGGRCGGSDAGVSDASWI